MSRTILSGLVAFRKSLEATMEKIPEIRHEFESSDLRDEYFENIKTHKETLIKRFDRFNNTFDRLMNLKSDQIEGDDRQRVDENIETGTELIAQFDDLIIKLDGEIRRIGQQQAADKEKRIAIDREEVRSSPSGSLGLIPIEARSDPSGASPANGSTTNHEKGSSAGVSPTEHRTGLSGLNPGENLNAIASGASLDANLNENNGNGSQRIRTVDIEREAAEEELSIGEADVKLPKVELVKFNGEIKKWQEFWDSFRSTVHERRISKIAKMKYLRLSLTGEAEKTILGLQLTADNYQGAIDLLKEQFGNKQAIIDSHYNFLTSLPVATNQTSSLRSLYNSLQQTFFSLEALGETVDQRQNVSIIKSKLPYSVIVNLEEKNGCAPWTLENLRKQLKQYIAARESADTTSASKFKPVSDQSKFKFSSEKSISTTGALFTNDRSASSRDPKCIYCGGGHYSNECSTYSTIEARKEKLKGRCFLCLQSNHIIRDCKSEKLCHFCRGERGRHHQSLCPDQFSNKRKNDRFSNKRKGEITNTAPTKRMKFNRGNDKRIVVSSSSTNDQSNSSTTTSAVENSLLSMGETVYLQTATTVVSNPDSRKSFKIRLLMDSGSSRSYASTNLVNRLKLKLTPQDPLKVYTFASSKSTQLSTSIADLKIHLIDGSDFTLTANVVRTITGAIQQAPINFDQYPIVKTLVLADPKIDEESDIDLLIGSDYYSEIMNGERIELSKGLYLLGSQFGWILNGRRKTELRRNSPSITLLIANTVLSKNDDITLIKADSQLTEKFDLQKFWDLDTIGIKEHTDDLGDEEALKKFNDTVRYVDNRYYVTWPWKNVDINLPSNFQLSLGRLNSLLARYKDKPQVFEAYQAVFDVQLEKGIIERVDQNQKSEFRTHYIPHHAVITPDRSTKLRIVYDGSAKAKKGDLSINECLYRGPVFLEDLCGLLIRFRLNPIAIIADIEKAFLQIGLQESERDITRFLWLRNPKLMTTKDNLEIYRFMRVPFGFITSPFLLAATIAYHLKKDDSAIAKNILKNIYVDNVITGVKSTKDAIDFYPKAKELFQSSSMNIREWASNSKEFIDQVPTSDRTNNTSTKVLGLNWNTITDELSITLIKDLPKEVTKRSILKFTASIFDPLGLFSPTILLAKLFLQKLWIAKFDWDDKLPEDLTAQWKSIIIDIVPLSNLKLPRFLGDNSNVRLSNLHCFCDASKNAYGTSIYLQSISNLSISVELLFAKARLAPIKEITIPYLELLAVLIGSKSVIFIRHELPFRIDQIFIWTDSQCVLHWLNSNKPMTVFVRNRISTIKNISDLNFRYVPTADNPADLPSRGASATDLISNTLWWHGPSFLKNADQASWPSMEFLSKINDDGVSTENSDLFSVPAFGPEGAVAEEINENFTPYGIEYKNYSNLNKLFRVTAYCNRFVNGVKKNRTISNLLTSDELTQAKIVWIKYIQKKCFSDSILAIENNNRKNSLVIEFGLFIDEIGLLRCGGRFQHSKSLSKDAIHPILLPKSDHFTDLIIDKIHKTLFHAGVSHTLSQIRNEFWIPAGRSVVYRFIRKCKICKKFDGGPFRAPPMPPLPVDRVSETTPFDSTGLDYFGPLYVKNFGKNAATSKVWICIFTCMTTRAVHLELVEDLSAIEFSMSLRRFISRRGTPTTIISDNARQFRTVSEVVRKGKDSGLSTDLCSYLSDRSITWKFITERAPWMGGFYERLVRLVKQALKKSIGPLILTVNQLRTIITEIEAVINSRPLAYVGSTFENGKIITPGHFLSLNPKTGRSIIDAKIGNLDKTTSMLENIRLSWKRGQRLVDQYWKNWRDDYLKNLRDRRQSKLKQPRVKSAVFPVVGEIVHLKGDGSRGSWKIGRIDQLITGADGSVRSARVRLPSGTLLTRAIAHLYPLECGSDSEEKAPENENSINDSHDDVSDDADLRENIDHDLNPGLDDDPEMEY